MVWSITESNAGIPQGMGHRQDVGTIPSHGLTLALVTMELKGELIAIKVFSNRFGYNNFGKQQHPLVRGLFLPYRNVQARKRIIRIDTRSFLLTLFS